MAEETIARTLERHRILALDSCVLIYHLEEHPEFCSAAEEVLRAVFQGRNSGVMSTVALMEVQVGPYLKGEKVVAEEYYGYLSRLLNVQWMPVTYAIADRAAELRAEYRLPVADAIHLATALECRAGCFVTNDLKLPEVPNIEYLFLTPGGRR